jgi:hypothetical protein
MNAKDTQPGSKPTPLGDAVLDGVARLADAP